MTIIAFLGSVFSPHYYRARRASPAADPLDHCAINIAVYGRGHRQWVFSEVPRGAVERRPELLTIGRSQLAWEGSTLRVRFDERSAVAGRRIAGEVRLEPSAIFDEALALDVAGRHRWWCVAPHSRATVELVLPRPLRFSGHAYHDANLGAEPLERAFHGWSWSRARLDDRTIVVYDSDRREGGAGRIVRSFAADGGLSTLDLPAVADLGRTRWGISRTTRCDAGGRAQVIRSLEDTPFYARSQIAADIGGVRAQAVYESLDLDRFTRPLVQHMLTYRIRRERRLRAREDR